VVLETCPSPVVLGVSVSSKAAFDVDSASCGTSFSEAGIRVRIGSGIDPDDDIADSSAIPIASSTSFASLASAAASATVSVCGSGTLGVSLPYILPK
jgi:hypothetical protein